MATELEVSEKLSVRLKIFLKTFEIFQFNWLLIFEKGFIYKYFAEQISFPRRSFELWVFAGLRPFRHVVAFKWTGEQSPLKQHRGNTNTASDYLPTICKTLAHPRQPKLWRCFFFFCDSPPRQKRQRLMPITTALIKATTNRSRCLSLGFLDKGCAILSWWLIWKRIENQNSFAPIVQCVVTLDTAAEVKLGKMGPVLSWRWGLRCECVCASTRMGFSTLLY